jgi:hypothetical protein
LHQVFDTKVIVRKYLEKLMNGKNPGHCSVPFACNYRPSSSLRQVVIAKNELR